MRHGRKQKFYLPVETIVIVLALFLLLTITVRQHIQIQNLQAVESHTMQSQSFQSNSLNNRLLSLQRNFNDLKKVETDVKHLIDQQQETEVPVTASSAGVCLIQGEYVFLDPDSHKKLRYLNTSPLYQLNNSSEAAAPQYPLGLEGDGPLLRVQYTGTGFLIDAEGHVVTNRHVTEPWKTDLAHQHLLELGFEPKLTMFRAFFPDCPGPVKMNVALVSSDDDIAVAQCLTGDIQIQPLQCSFDDEALKVGHTVLILGYPTGFDLLLARMNNDELRQLGVGYDEVACNLARKKLIAPVATRGMCGRISGNKIIYDAQTAVGASGAPVINNRGQVVAINTALLKGFAGTNFGIPINSVKPLLTKLKSMQK